MSILPFQLQYRNFKSSPPGHWLVMPIPKYESKDLMKKNEKRYGKDPVEAVVISIPLGNEDKVFNCIRGKVRAPQSLDLDRGVWDCKGHSKDRTTECKVVSTGFFEKEPEHGHYWLSFHTGVYAGKKVEFKNIRYGSKAGFGNGFIFPKECSRFSLSTTTPSLPKAAKTKTVTMTAAKASGETLAKPIGSSVRDALMSGRVSGAPSKASITSKPSSAPKPSVLPKPKITKKMVPSKKVGLLSESYFFKNGYYRKANSCKKIYKQAKKGDKICGKEVAPDQVGSYKMDALSSLESCVTDGVDYLIETKFNGHRAILEYKNGNAGMFSGKSRDDKLFPTAVTKLLANHLSTYGSTVHDLILDGEVFLKECNMGGGVIVPEIGMQTKAIKGNHNELIEHCNFSYQIFDIIRLNGKDVSKLPLKERKNLIKSFFPSEVKANINDLVDIKSEKKLITGKNISLEPVLGKTMNSIKDIYEEYCQVINTGQEGLMIKDPDDSYDWRGRKSAARSGWYKLKEEFDVDTAVTQACLGPWKKGTKTNQHLTRYKELHLSACEDPECKKLIEVAKSQSNAGGGPISGWKDWDDTIHYPLLNMFLEGKAKPSKGTEYRKLDKIMDAVFDRDLALVNDDEEMERMMGKNTSYGISKDKDKDAALPVCIDIPSNDFIVEVVTTEINLDSKGKPHLGGPPRVVRVRKDKKFPNDFSYLYSLYGRELGGEKFGEKIAKNITEGKPIEGLIKVMRGY